jgi:RNA polymerase sigma-70 factor (ECF subfamily)
VEREVEILENKELVEKVFSMMKPKYREILFLRYLENKSYEEISDILKKSVGTIGTLVARAKKNFKKELERIRNKK